MTIAETMIMMQLYAPAVGLAALASICLLFLVSKGLGWSFKRLGNLFTAIGDGIGSLLKMGLSFFPSKSQQSRYEHDITAPVIAIPVTEDSTSHLNVYASQNLSFNANVINPSAPLHPDTNIVFGEIVGKQTYD